MTDYLREDELAWRMSRGQLNAVQLNAMVGDLLGRLSAERTAREQAVERVGVLEESTIALAECGTQWADKFHAAESQLTALREELAALKERWIPVSERLPELGVTVLAFDDSFAVATIVSDEEINDDSFLSNPDHCTASYFKEFFNYWRPLPAPPEGI